MTHVGPFASLKQCGLQITTSVCLFFVFAQTTKMLLINCGTSHASNLASGFQNITGHNPIEGKVNSFLPR